MKRSTYAVAFLSMIVVVSGYYHVVQQGRLDDSFVYNRNLSHTVAELDDKLQTANRQIDRLKTERQVEAELTDTVDDVNRRLRAELATMDEKVEKIDALLFEIKAYRAHARVAMISNKTD